MVHALRALRFTVHAADLYVYDDPLVPDIRTEVNVFDLRSLAGYRYVITDLPYREQPAILSHLLPLAARDGAHVAVLARSEWSSAAARRTLIHANARFAGEVRLTKRPEWVRPAIASPRHGSAGSSGRQSRARLGKIHFCASLDRSLAFTPHES
jgi:hypothetical protein